VAKAPGRTFGIPPFFVFARLARLVLLPGVNLRLRALGTTYLGTSFDLSEHPLA